MQAVKQVQSHDEFKQLSASTAGLVVGLEGCETCTSLAVKNFEGLAGKHQDVTFAAHVKESHMTKILHHASVHYYKGGEEVDHSDAGARPIESFIQKLK